MVHTSFRTVLRMPEGFQTSRLHAHVPRLCTDVPNEGRRISQQTDFAEFPKLEADRKAKRLSSPRKSRTPKHPTELKLRARRSKDLTAKLGHLSHNQPMPSCTKITTGIPNDRPSVQNRIRPGDLVSRVVGSVTTVTSASNPNPLALHYFGGSLSQLQHNIPPKPYSSHEGPDIMWILVMSWGTFLNKRVWESLGVTKASSKIGDGRRLKLPRCVSGESQRTLKQTVLEPEKEPYFLSPPTSENSIGNPHRAFYRRTLQP